jgi:hypothetical protein
MPRGDRTGPEGEGPLTGRGVGYCAGYPTPGHANAMPGYRRAGRRAARWGRGARGRLSRGPGRRWARFGPVPAWNPPTREQEAEALKAHAEWLTGELDAVNRRLDELEPSE